MKDIQLKWIALGIICFFLSCTDALDKNPLNQMSVNTTWESEQGAMIVLTGAYRGNVAYNGEVYIQDDWWGYYGLVFLENASDNVLDRRRSGSPLEQLINGTLASTNATIGQYWSIAYNKITRCNDVISNVEKVPMDNAKKLRMKAEARFIRAAQYFYLSQFFGDVPLVTTLLTAQEANNEKRTSKADITKWLIKEFSESANDLPRYKDIAASERGRASRQAALAFLGRLQLADKRYNDAIATYKQIIDYGDNMIDPDYKSLFLLSNETSKENIFSTTYTAGTAGNPMAQQAMPAKDGGWCFICPTGSLFEAYQFTNGENFSYSNSLYDPQDLEKNRDPRLKYTLICNGSRFRGSTYISSPDSTTSGDATTIGQQRTQTGFLMRKYMEESILGVSLVSGFGNDIPIIRYSEVLLSYLEANLEAGNPITQSLLDETINQVRGRASVNMPPITETNPSALRPILRNERRVELAMEGIRYWDLIRWGVAHEILQGKVWGSPFPGSAKPNANRDPDQRWDTEISRSFRNPQDYRWPVPQSEQNKNPNLRD